MFQISAVEEWEINIKWFDRSFVFIICVRYIKYGLESCFVIA